MHSHTQSSPHSQNQTTYDNLKTSLQTQSQKQKIIDGLQPYNQYQVNIDEPKSHPKYDANDFLNMEQLPPNKLDGLINCINEQILKQNELIEWFKRVVDSQKK